MAGARTAARLDARSCGNAPGAQRRRFRPRDRLGADRTPRPDVRLGRRPRVAIERGSERSGLELQIDLDTSAGNLSERLDLLDSVPGRLTVELSPGTFLRSDLLPLARLYEVIIHHVDLDCGFEVSQINPLTARWLLEWSVLSYQAPYGMAVRLVSTSGFTAVLGASNSETVISGPDAVLLGWLTGRLSAAEALHLPAQPPLI